MPYLKARYRFIPVAKNKTKAIYEGHADPGGLLPKWIVNMVALETSLYTPPYVALLP